MSNIITAPISLIDENPHRNLGTYPTIESKVKTLMRSFEDIGVWEGIIGRRHPTDVRFQIAFGHHRLEAAKRLGLTEIPIILRQLTDEQMLKFMGRENGEDYSTQFLVMLNTWEGAAKFLRHGGEKSQAVETARVLGWMVPGSAQKHPQGKMNETAQACAAAHALITGGYLARIDLEDLSVKAAKEIVQRAHARMEQIEKAAKATSAPRRQTEAAKKHVAKGAKTTAREVKEGKIAQKDIRAEVDVNAYKSAATSKVKDTPLFAVFGQALSKAIAKLLKEDANSEKLIQIEKAVNQVTMEEDRTVLRQLDYELSELGIRTDNWRKRLIPTSEKVVGLPRLEKNNG